MRDDVPVLDSLSDSTVNFDPQDTHSLSSLLSSSQKSENAFEPHQFMLNVKLEGM